MASLLKNHKSHSVLVCCWCQVILSMICCCSVSLCVALRQTAKAILYLLASYPRVYYNFSMLHCTDSQVLHVTYRSHPDVSDEL